MVEGIVQRQLSFSIYRVDRIGRDQKSDQLLVAASSHSIMKSVPSSQRRDEIRNGPFLQEEPDDGHTVVGGRFLQRSAAKDVPDVDHLRKGQTRKSLKVIVDEPSRHQTGRSHCEEERRVIVFVCLEGKAGVLIEHSGDPDGISLLDLLKEKSKILSDRSLIKVHQLQIVLHSFVLEVVEDVGLQRERRDVADVPDDPPFHLLDLHKTRDSVDLAGDC